MLQRKKLPRPRPSSRKRRCTVTPAVQLDVVKEDPADNKIVECAVTAGAEYIVTGDKDLLRLVKYESIRILSVVDFLEFIINKGIGR